MQFKATRKPLPEIVRQLKAQQYDSAIQQFQKTLDLYPDRSSSHYEMGWAYVYKGMYKEGIAEIEKSIQLDGDDPSLSPDLAYVYALQGRRSEAQGILNRLLELQNGRWFRRQAILS